ncbi:MAG: alpha-glucuronidase [Lachnospiraceae bacterium]|nr:alpha-glucuronidase [Lachnospiraceae bacterium]
MDYERAWLSYRKRTDDLNRQYFTVVYGEFDDPVVKTAVQEIGRAAAEMLDMETERKSGTPEPGATGIWLKQEETLSEEEYHICEKDGLVVITAGGPGGILYGSFACIRYLQTGRTLKGADFAEKPSNPLRMLNHWDNMDGSIERGYSGKSFFFRDQEVLVNERTVEYARLAASVGINGVVINNVNVRGNATRLIEEPYASKVAEMAGIFAEYGIRLFLSLNFAAPMELGGFDTSDPLDEKVREWWKEKMREVFARIPNLGGFLVKADSEGRPGPFTYGRDHADGANMLAEAVKPYGGIIIWRCFVYNCQQDWRDYKTDRARSGYDNFASLDGRFLDNVILQVKNGPMDFQVREPVHPLFGGMKETNQILEVQIAQEYTGQQRHVCYLIPMFREILAFRTYCREEADTVADIVSGRTWGNTRCGMAAVANTGDDANWTGHDLAAANLYGFGRLSFNTDLTAEEIAEEWITCTFGEDSEVREKILTILMMSWPAYEKYNAPLGIGWMVNPNFHYGPSVDGYEYSRWGTYHRADHEGLGVDRSDKGTGYAMQYNEPNASLYNDLDSCPDELKLFFHHVPYTYRLRSGKTVLQHIYDTHFEGVSDVEKMKELWQSLEGKIPEKIYRRALERLEHQVWHAAEWRDQINSYFFRKTGIGDEQGREIY